MFGNFVELANEFLWGNILVYLMLVAAALFTWRLKFIQIFRFREMITALARPAILDPDGISPFQALCTTLAARVGTGNIAGVAVALYLGGPGATFWMWVVALFGMATAFAESSLAQLFKVRDAQGRYRGGPAFYMARGLNAKWLAALFSVCLIIAFGLIFNAVQANSISDSLLDAFGVS